MHRYPKLLPRSPKLRVTVYSAKGLPPADVNGKADPYCTMQLAGGDLEVSTERILKAVMETNGREDSFEAESVYSMDLNVF